MVSVKMFCFDDDKVLLVRKLSSSNAFLLLNATPHLLFPVIMTGPTFSLHWHDEIQSSNHQVSIHFINIFVHRLRHPFVSQRYIAVPSSTQKIIYGCAIRDRFTISQHFHGAESYSPLIGLPHRDKESVSNNAHINLRRLELQLLAYHYDNF